MGLKALPQPGDVLDLTTRWGTTTRNKCPVCTRFLKSVEILVCTCGAEYRAAGKGYEVVRIRDIKS